jgi:hypothetical protein
MSRSGVLISAWVEIQGGCDIEYTICGDTVEFILGGGTNGLQLDATERGLEKLIHVSSEALAKLRAADH